MQKYKAFYQTESVDLEARDKYHARAKAAITLGVPRRLQVFVHIVKEAEGWTTRKGKAI